MPEDSTSNPNQSEDNAENLVAEVHWIQHATFYSQIALFLVGIIALIIYYGQLKQMIYATQAAQDSAYDACMSAKIARRTLLEVQSSEDDSHQSALGAIEQASAATRATSALIVVNAVGLPADYKAGDKLNATFQGFNMGRSAAKRVHLHIAFKMLKQGLEPSLTGKKTYFDDISSGLLQAGNGFTGGPHLTDDENKFVTLDAKQLEDLSVGKLWIAEFGRLDYQDINGISHWETFCSYMDKTVRDPTDRSFPHAQCAAYNNQDTNGTFATPTPSTSQAKQNPIEEIVCVAPKR